MSLAAEWSGVEQSGVTPAEDIVDDGGNDSNSESSSIEGLSCSDSQGSSSESLFSTSDSEDCFRPQVSNVASVLDTFKIIGENIDKDIKPRDMRADHRTRSLHYFHTYAVKDRIELDKYSDDTSHLNGL